MIPNAIRKTCCALRVSDYDRVQTGVSRPEPPREVFMADYRIISADSHIVEPPDMYTARFAPKLRNRAPHMERRKTPAGREYDAWMLEGQQVGTLGAVMQAVAD
jgi:hypothetical protein